MVRYALAPVCPWAAHALGLPRTLSELGGERTAPSAAAESSAIPATRAGMAVPGVAITFDDGPHPQGTPAILGILGQAGVRAAFFVVGEQVERRPALAREILDQGHVLALHGHRHRLQLRLAAGSLAEDLARGRDAIERATGTLPSLHRPPYGIYSPGGLEHARQAGLQPLLWSRWGKDWRKFTTPARIAARVTGQAAPGDVILLHDADFYSATGSHERTAAALPTVIERLRGRGLDTVLPI